MKKRNFIMRILLLATVIAIGSLLVFQPKSKGAKEEDKVKDIPAPVPQTRQTISYAPGDDGDLQMGVPWTPEKRFTDIGNGAIIDNLTGLIWLEDANCFGGQTWFEALTDCNNLEDGICGLTDESKPGDWRLPNVRELHSLVDYAHAVPMALPDGHPFVNVTFNYWSSTTFDGNPGQAWVMNVGAGYPFRKHKSLGCSLWCVRGGN